MKRGIHRPAALFAFVCFVMFLSPSEGAQVSVASGKALAGATYTISGTVVSATSGTPLAQARVSLMDTKNSRNAATLLTGEDGRFVFRQLPAGKYSLRGSRRGYLDSGYQQHEQFWSAIVTGEGCNTQNLQLRLMPAAVISGRVLDETGEPVRNATATLYMEGHSSGTTRVVPAGNAQTNDLGAFEFFSLSPGKYFAAVSATPWYAVHPPAAPSGASGPPTTGVDRPLDVAYPTTYYGGATESDEASPITIKGGEHQEIDIRLAPVESLHLRFRLPTEEGQQGAPMPVLEKHVFDSVDYLPETSFSAISPGVFEMSGVPAGKYTLRVPSAVQGQPAKFSEADIRNDGQELEIEKAERAGSLKLSLRMASGEPLAKQLGLGLQDERQQVVTFSPVGADGTVMFDELAPGTYKIIIMRTPEKAYAVGRILTESGQPVGPGVNVAAGVELQLNVTLVSGVARVEGFAKQGGKPASGVMVVLIPSDPESHPDLFRRDESDSDGSFSLPDIIPGTYTIAAIEDAWDFDWSQPSALARYAQNGQTVTIPENNAAAIHLPAPVQVQPH